MKLNFVFDEAMRQVSGSLIPAKGRDPKKEGKLLADFLRSDTPLDASMRRQLADLVSGQTIRMAGGQSMDFEMEIEHKYRGKRPELKGKVFTFTMDEVVSRYFELKCQGESKMSIYSQLTEEFGIGSTTVDNYRKRHAEESAWQFEDGAQGY